MSVEKVSVRPVRSYEDAVDGYKQAYSEPYEVDRLRADELKRNGLVALEGEDGYGEKAAPEVQNKMAPATMTKVGAPSVVAPTGRPVEVARQEANVQASLAAPTASPQPPAQAAVRAPAARDKR